VREASRIAEEERPGAVLLELPEDIAAELCDAHPIPPHPRYYAEASDAVLQTVADLIVKARRVYLCGNGGSAANACHFANDLMACGIRAHSLTSDVSTLTAIANDYGYENVFSYQVKIYGEEGDLLIGLSGSGKSPNVLNALNTAFAMKMETVMITGFMGGQSLSSWNIHRGKDMQEAENAQLVLAHEVRQCLLSRN
jgi:D-sedoheptulose 7-phosphate isomerase